MNDITETRDDGGELTGELVAAVDKAQEVCQKIHEQLRKVFFGQEEVLSQVMAAFLSGGHLLLEGKPGLGKTHLVLSLSQTFGGDFGRIQFTPDLMPSDVTGFTLFDMKSQSFRMQKGPVFTNLLLGDEINRAPAKTQAALLEVMQEMQVTIDGESLKLEPPFMVLATQNPIEQEGTYPLPEAQLDRFLMKVVIDYPDQACEEEVVRRVSSGAAGLDMEEVAKVCSPSEILETQRQCSMVTAVDEVVRYAVNICRASRHSQGISLGAGTRGAIGLIQVAKAYALMEGRSYITPDDVKAASLPVLRHRIQLAPELTISGQQVDEAVAAIVTSVESPRM